jgi:hypothetical protein
MVTERELASVYGIFASRQQAERAAGALQRHGRAEAAISITAASPGRYHVEDEDPPVGTGTRIARGVARGAPLGSLAGHVVVEGIAWLVPGAAFLRLPGLLLGAWGGAIWGMASGAFGALLHKELQREASAQVVAVEQGGRDVLLVAQAAGDPDQLKRELRSSGARFFLNDVYAVEAAGVVSSRPAAKATGAARSAGSGAQDAAAERFTPQRIPVLK